MKALISPNEIFTHTWASNWSKDDQNEWQPIYSSIEECIRVVEVKPDNEVFEVASPLYWVDCPDTCKADYWYFKDDIVSEKPTNAPVPVEE